MRLTDVQSTDDALNQEVSNRILTVPNVISFIRLCLVPVCFVLLLNQQNIPAACLFAFTAATDFIDGQIARRTNSVSRLGQLLDPTVDRVLMIAAVLGLLIIGRLPLWIVALVLIRDIGLLIGGYVLLKRYRIRIAVIYAGKVATTLLFVGCAGLILNMPLIPGLGICSLTWLPGFTFDPVCWAIWFVYAGLVLAIITTSIYVKQAIDQLHIASRSAD